MQQPPGEEEKQYVKQMLDEMDPEPREMLIHAVNRSDNAQYSHPALA